MHLYACQCYMYFDSNLDIILLIFGPLIALSHVFLQAEENINNSTDLFKHVSVNITSKV